MQHLLSLLWVLLMGTALAQNNPLLDTRWTLAAYAQGGRMVPVSLEVGATLEFTQSRAGGQSGCNSFGGSYTLEGPTLRFGPLVQTMMACPDEATNRLERAYLQALEKAETFRIVGRQLTLYDADGKILLNLSR